MAKNDVNLNAMAGADVDLLPTAGTTAYASRTFSDIQGRCNVSRKKIARIENGD